MVATVPPTSWAVAWKRRSLVTLALILDVGATCMIFAFHMRLIFLPPTPNAALYRVLPVVGAITGTLIAAANAWAISTLVTAYAKTMALSDGMTFAHIDRLYALANARIPLGVTPLLLLATVITIAEGLLPSALVSIMTPTAAPWIVYLSMPAVDFSASSGVTPNIMCEYFSNGVNADEAGHGYGINCPIDSSFGDLYNVAAASMWNEIPQNSSRKGVTYPSDLLGISGAISEITKEYVAKLDADPNRAVIAADYLDTCLPRMVVDSRCVGSLPEGDFFNMTWIPVNGSIPQCMCQFLSFLLDLDKGAISAIIEVDYCYRATNTCDGEPRYAPFYGNGVSIVFWKMDPNSGSTTLSLFNFASYNETIWGTDSIQCKISPHEEMVPVRIRGGAFVEHQPTKFGCTGALSQPSPRFLLNVTRMADMTLVKLQGQDGDITPAAAIPPGRDRVQALSVALKNIVAMGATEMYATMYANHTVRGQWTGTVPLRYVTTRNRLGSDSKENFAFIACPLVLTIIIVAGCAVVAGRPEPNVPFNPLHPGSAMAAGMNRQELSLLVREHDTADTSALGDLPVILRFRPVTDERWGIDTRATHPSSLASHRRKKRESRYPEWLYEPLGTPQPIALEEYNLK
ncbi:hypothetical protein EXIGLDRAFT_828605 [Exidia glandulosa HHB12029]|uniref:Uncharacterized protein n=1 Tax=Exidia glandulosa HHB12029 TaxID=1314781 RepID=A0A165Q8H2_EXIGL|nr:hypothetical protein EXIGLDRAFT_828605 [Exidia glandulosa HHB12029]